MKTYAIVIHGDSYYRNRIRRESYGALLSNDMHHTAGLVGMYEGQNTGNIHDLKNTMRQMADDAGSELELNGKYFEDSLCFYEIKSRAQIKREYGIDILK